MTAKIDQVRPVPLPTRSVVPGTALTPGRARLARARRVMTARGLMETIGFSFIAYDEARKFGDAPESLRLLNPIAADLDQMRPTPVPNLLAAARRNAARGWPDRSGMPVSASCRAETISMGETLSRAFLPVSRVPVTMTVSPLSAALMAVTGAFRDVAVRAAGDCLPVSAG